MIIKLYKTRLDKLNNQPIIIKNVIKIVDQTSDNEIDILVKANDEMAGWECIENRDGYYLITITEE